MSSYMRVPLHIIFLVALAMALIPRPVWAESLGMSASLAMPGITPKSTPGIARDWSTQADLRGESRSGEHVGWEKPYYNYNSNSCAPGKICGHYTQVVWRNSVLLGCAKAKCATGGTLVTCNYDPPGNVIGQKSY
ncbi:hypothetical protein BT93_G0422 [Corymbia citriodora subsp. variegata]|nr:hypothetical protein BT93_G0422 [Corymbia citriodora subsp. variegata]